MKYSWPGFGVVLAACVLAGCAGSDGGRHRPSSAADAPLWARVAPQDSDAMMYGVGEGADKDAASQAALRDFAAKLGVPVGLIPPAPDSTLAETAGRPGVPRREQNEVHGNTAYTLLTFERRPLAAETRRRLDEVVTALRQGTPAATRAGDSTSSIGKLERLRAVSSLRPLATEGGHLLKMMLAVRPGFSELPYRKHIDDARRLAEEAVAKVSFRLQYKESDSDVAGMVRQMMRDADFRLSDSDSENVTGVVHVASDSQAQTLFGKQVVRLVVSVSLRSDKGVVFAQRNYAVEGTHAKDVGDAREAALERLATAFKSRGAAGILGLESARQ